MLLTAAPMFLMIPRESGKKGRILHAGRVIHLDGARATAQLEEPLHLDPGEEVVIFAEVRGKFFQQGAVINEIVGPIEPSGSPAQTVSSIVAPPQAATPPLPSLSVASTAAAPLTFTLTRVGDAVSAEQRQLYRVSVASADLFALVGREKECRVVDLSAQGFAAITKAEWKVGASVQTVLRLDGRDTPIAARVQTAKLRYDGKFRYGFLATEPRGDARRWLETTTATMQRLQLRRLAGAA